MGVVVFVGTLVAVAVLDVSFFSDDNDDDDDNDAMVVVGTNSISIRSIRPFLYWGVLLVVPPPQQQYDFGCTLVN